VSPDPQLKPYDPQDLNPYAYAEGDPATGSDPSGLGVIGDGCNNNTCYDEATGQGGTVNTDPAGETYPGWNNSGSSDNTYVPITPHVIIQKSDPYYTSMIAAYHNFLQGNPGWKIANVGQEAIAWHMICESNPHACPPGFVEQVSPSTYMRDALTGIGLPAGKSIIVVSKAFGKIGGADLLASTGGGSCNSFASGTRILLANGKAAQISSLRPGDQVLATDTKTGKTGPEAIAAVELDHDTDLYDLKVKTPQGLVVIHTTSNHLFWDPAAREWVRASGLLPGEPLSTPAGSSVAAAGGAAPAIHDGWMWDLTVPGGGDHDFYVATGVATRTTGRHASHAGAAALSVLVHNSDCWTPTDDEWDYIYDSYHPSVVQGVEWNVLRYNEGATGHALNGIGKDAVGTAEYLARPHVFDYMDAATGNLVSFDAKNQILLISTNTNIHAYNFDSVDWANSVTQGRYVPVGVDGPVGEP
jgi:hypothetical protein